MITNDPATSARHAQSDLAAVSREGTHEAIDAYLGLQRGVLAERIDNYDSLVDRYYDLVTDFYEFGWGECFHFAPRWRGESLRESIVLHEQWLARKLGLDGASRVLDVGCGVGGPMRAIHRLTGCQVVGINNNAYQVRRAELLNRRADVSAHCELLKADFMAMPLSDASVDAAYAIEATVHAPSLAGVYAEIRRVLRPCGLFGTYEWCMTSAFDPADAVHQAIKRQIEISCGVPCMGSTLDVLDAMRQAGLEILQAEDRGVHGDVPWWEPLSPSWRSLSSLRSSDIGARMTIATLRVLEPLHIVPRGTVSVARMLTLGARALVAGGRLGIFTPAFFVLAKKARA